MLINFLGLFQLIYQRFLVLMLKFGKEKKKKGKKKKKIFWNKLRSKRKENNFLFLFWKPSPKLWLDDLRNVTSLPLVDTVPDFVTATKPGWKKASKWREKKRVKRRRGKNFISFACCYCSIDYTTVCLLIFFIWKRRQSKASVL